MDSSNLRDDVRRYNMVAKISQQEREAEQEAEGHRGEQSDLGEYSYILHNAHLSTLNHDCTKLTGSSSLLLLHEEVKVSQNSVQDRLSLLPQSPTAATDCLGDNYNMQNEIVSREK